MSWPRLRRRLLESFAFPLGELCKPDVRRLAAQAGLEGHSAPESQEICFVPDDDHRRFLRERLGGLPGDIVDGEGRVRGRHEGTYNYTIGQRKGLGIAAAEPLYVIAVEAKERRVIIGTAAEGLVGALQVAGLTWHRACEGGPLTIQVRSAGSGSRGRQGRSDRRPADRGPQGAGLRGGAGPNGRHL